MRLAMLRNAVVQEPRCCNPQSLFVIHGCETSEDSLISLSRVRHVASFVTCHVAEMAPILRRVDRRGK